MSNVTATTIKLDAEVIVCKSTRNKILGYRAQMETEHYEHLETQMYPTKAEALAELKRIVLEASGRVDPVVIYFADLVGVGYYRAQFGWCYSIYRDQANDQTQTCIHSGYTDKLDVTRALRRHMGSNIGGIQGGDVILNPEDRAEHFRSEAWHAGCYFWRVSRNLDLDDVLKDRQLDDTMREAGDRARRRYSDLTVSGAPCASAFVTVRGELDGLYGNGNVLEPFTLHEQEMKRHEQERLSVAPIVGTVGGGGLMRRLGIAARAE